MEDELKVGDEVVVYLPYEEKPPADGVVIRIGNTLCDIRYNGTATASFRLDTGIINDTYGLFAFATKAEYAEIHRRKELMKQVADAGLGFRIDPAGFSLDHLEKIAAVARLVKREAEEK